MKLALIFILVLTSCSDRKYKEQVLYTEFAKDSMNQFIDQLLDDISKKRNEIKSLQHDLDSIKIRLIKNSPIKYVNKKLLNFSNESIKDTLIISVIGKSWKSSIFQIKVMNHLNRNIYYFEKTFRSMEIDFHENAHLYLDRSAKSLIIFPDKINSTKDLYEYLGNKENYETYNERLSIPLKDYNQLKNKDFPILQHQSYYEGWKKVYFDRDSNKVIELFDGGL